MICVRSVSSLTLHVRILLQITSCHYKSSITDCYEFSLFSSDLTLSRDRPSRSKQSKSSKIIWSHGMIQLWIIILMIVGLSTKWSTHQCEYCIKYTRPIRIIIIHILMQIAHFIDHHEFCTLHLFCYIQLWYNLWFRK